MAQGFRRVIKAGNVCREVGRARAHAFRVGSGDLAVGVAPPGRRLRRDRWISSAPLKGSHPSYVPRQSTLVYTAPRRR